MEDRLVSQPILAAISKMAVSSIARKLAANKILPVDTSSSRKKYKASDARKIMSTIFLDKDLPIKRKIHVFYNFKGGTGKTSLCSQTAFMLHLMGFKVLAIDCDSQSHLSTVLGFKEDSKVNTIYDVLINGVSIEESIYIIDEALDAIPSNLGLTRIEVPLSQKPKREEVLGRIIRQVERNYDFILIDTNPTISTLNMSALYAAHHVNIVCETQPFSLHGLGMLVEEIEKLFNELERPLNYSIIANKHETKTATSQEVLGVLRRDYSDRMNQSLIRKSEDINIASKKSQPVYAFASKASLALEDLIDYAHELLQISRKPLDMPFNYEEQKEAIATA